MYLCAMGVDFVSVYDCSDRVVCFVFNIILYTGQSLLASTVCKSANVQNESVSVEGKIMIFFNACAK